MTIQEFSALFRSELNRLYSAGELDAMWRWFLSDRIPNQSDAVRRNHAAPVDGALLEKMKADLDRLKSGEPFQYVMGHSFFFGMRLSVDKRVLIPRPETEEMLDLIAGQNNFDPASIVDVCTGSGCIALGLKKSFPRAHVVAVDIEPGALELAEQNAEHIGLDVEWRLQDILQENWFDALPKQTQLIVSNPPYVLPSEAHGMHASVLEHEPSVALFVPDEDPLLFYKPIAEYGRNTLAKGGQLWLEINPLKSVQMVELLIATGFSAVEIVHDMSGKPRFVKAVR